MVVKRRKNKEQELGVENRNVKEKMMERSKEQEHHKNSIGEIRMSDLLTDMRLWKNKDRYET